MIKILTCLLTCWIGTSAVAQKVWSVDQCMKYAVEHNRTVKQRRLEISNDKLARIKAIGNFLPGINGSVGAQYNFGRSVDPETNTYNTVSTFNNGYSMQTSIPIFTGGSLINQVRQSKVDLLLGKAALQEAQDNTALETFQAYIDALYYYGSTSLAQKKLTESDSLLYKTRRQEELGLKGRADVAQMEAQQATDMYNLTQQRNLYATAMLVLKQKMNFPSDDALVLDTCILYTPILDHIQPPPEHTDDVFRIALKTNPTLRQSALNKKRSQISKKMTWSNLVPSISLSGGISSSYYKELHKNGYPNFGKQFDNNFGSYIGINMSIPIFNRMSGIISLRQAKNNYRIAYEQYEAQKETLQQLVQQAIQDQENALRESIQMEKKVASDSLAYHVTRRKYEEGLMTSLDLQNNAAILQESKVSLLRSKLIYIMKCRLVNYYKGESIIESK